MIFIVVIIVLTVLKMANNFFLFVGWFAVVSWVVYQLVGKLGIVGNKNILIFIGMSVFFYIVIGAILGVIF